MIFKIFATVFIGALVVLVALAIGAQLYMPALIVSFVASSFVAVLFA